MTAKRVTRFDQGELQKAERTPAGFLRAPAYITRVGVFAYKMGDGQTRRELRHPDDVFNKASLATLAGVPVTDDHPNVSDPETMLLTPENVSDFMVGVCGDAIGEDQKKFVTAPLTIMKQDAIDAVEGGKTQVSAGYTCDFDETPGEYQGQAYDARQRNIVYNHVAIVERGRAGPEVRMRLDSADAVQVDALPNQEGKMEQVELGGVKYNVTPELAAAIKAATAPKDPAQNDAAVTSPGGDTSTAVQSGAAPKTDDPGDGDGKNPPAAAPGAPDKQKMDHLQAKCDSLTAEIEKFKGGRSEANEGQRVSAAVKERLRIERVAQRVLPRETVAKLDSMDDAAIKAAVIVAEHPKTDLKGKSAEYVSARFDHIADGLASDPTDDLGEELHGARVDAAADGDDPVEKSRLAARERAKNAWKPKAANAK